MEKKYLNLKEIQLEEFKILKLLAEFLDRNDIYYVLSGGSMLGAVRHNGFIPWDDDIDILIPRHDYEKLKRIATPPPYVGEYRICFPGDDKYPFPFVKVVNEKLIVKDSTKDNSQFPQYLWVDVFPLDHWPNNKFLSFINFAVIRIYKKLLVGGTVSKDFLYEAGYYSNRLKSIVVNLGIWFYRKLGGYKKLAKRIDKLASAMNEKYKNSDRIGNITWLYGMKSYYRKNMTLDRELHVFEEGEFYILKDFDGYLSSYYDDYMTLPPEDKRDNHKIKVYRLQNS